MKVKLSDMRLVQVPAENPVELAEGWYAVVMAAKMIFGPFGSPAEWSDWVTKNKVKEVTK